jgi:GNAT superfamily N-acetyltransferase
MRTSQVFLPLPLPTIPSSILHSFSPLPFHTLTQSLPDVPTILKFIHDLAAFEKEPASTVEATEKSLADTIAFDVEPGSDAAEHSTSTERSTKSSEHSTNVRSESAERSTKTTEHSTNVRSTSTERSTKSSEHSTNVRSKSTERSTKTTEHSTTERSTGTTERSTAISPSRPARCLLLLHPSSPPIPVGIALYFYNYSTWRAKPGIYLEDLYISPEHRGKGYGTALLSKLAREVVDMGGGRLDWSVLRWNEKAIRVYEGEKVGARMLGEWVGMRVEGAALGKLGGL